MLRARIAMLLLGVTCALFATSAASCGIAWVRVSFRFSWTPRGDAAFPVDWPTPGFSKMVCATHSTSYSMWMAGLPASNALRALAENGDHLLLAAELKTSHESDREGVQDFALVDSDQHDGDVVAESAPLPPVSEVDLRLRLNGSRNAVLVSCAAGIVPSPDFFVGFSARSVCDADGSWSRNATKPQKLRAWDANTDDGETYLSADRPTDVPSGERKAIVALLGFRDTYGTFTLRVEDDSGEPVAISKDRIAESNTKGGASEPACFPADELLHIAGGRTIRMDRVRPGEHAAAQVATDGSPSSSPIVFMSHAAHGVRTEFVHLAFVGGGRLRLSPGHYVFTPGNTLVAAGTLRQGDIVISASGSALSVESTTLAVGTGLYAPQAASGEMVVSGVRVSCYTRAIAPALAHAIVLLLEAAPVIFVRTFETLVVSNQALRRAVACLGPLFSGAPVYTR